MDVLSTGAYGTCGTALIDHLYDRPEYEFTNLNRSDRPDDHPYGGYETVLANVSEYEAIRPAFDGQDAVVHWAADPSTNAPWDSILESNIIGTYNVLEAAKEAEVESVVFASTNHVMGMWETLHSPEIYGLDSDILVDHTDPVRPDSYYGTSKAFGEDLGRYYVENHEYPEQFYALRICNVADAAHDHPYAHVEERVARGELERGSEAYVNSLNRKKAMWHSRRDLAHQVDCCLQDDDVDFDVFYGVSDNDRRWFDIEHAREVIGYEPRDNGEDWDGPA
jgi:nucleoside-diphosphate-sugar epimerase